MGLFQKLGIIESDEKEVLLKDLEIADLYNAEISNTEELNIDTSVLVTPEDVYLSKNLTDLSKSIFKVDEIKKVLPSSMTEETKKQSVIGMMQVSQITKEEVIEDADLRTESLLIALDHTVVETEHIISNGEEEIRRHEAEIEILKDTIEKRKKLQEDQNKIISLELEKIKNIKDFIL